MCNAVTAGKYRYKAYPFGSTPASVSPSASVDITPWVSATTVFPTADLAPGLYSVWVEAQHTFDSSLAVTATTDMSTSYAIGAQHCTCFVWLSDIRSCTKESAQCHATASLICVLI